ncbi:MAG: PD-(D/E)XK nuclease family protein [Proteobacteria bacterium]|nr:PD-(D/E)XK nuclease family protein [Pseudomonadota bacterium]
MFRNKYISATRLTTYEQCPRRFRLTYIDEFTRESTEEADFGSLLHRVLERYYRDVRERRYAGPIDAEDLGRIYRDEWASGSLSGLARFREGMDILAAYARDNPLVDGSDVLAVEHEFLVPLGDRFAYGYMDRVDRLDGETILITDYKSNRRVYTREELASNLQLTLYALAARHEWPWATSVILSFYMLRHGISLYAERTQDELDRARAYILAVTEQTETAGDYPANLSALCSWCGQRARCNVYQAALAADVPESLPVAPQNAQELVEERERVHALQRIYEARKRDLDDALRVHLDEHGAVESATHRYSLGTTSRKHYPVEKTLSLLMEAAGLDEGTAKSILCVDAKALSSLVSRVAQRLSRPQAKALRLCLDAIADVSVSPRILTKAI